jgi:pantetheine-phosphate adenylyltransferase
MTKPICLFSGTFSPPTIGHFDIACQAAKMFDELTILCSVNPNKCEILFSPEECKNLWSTYCLPKNVKVLTLEELLAVPLKKKNIVMVRGIRDSYDFEYEKEVMDYNQKRFGINKFFYIHSNGKYKDVSSSKTRDMAKKIDLRGLSKMLSPLTLSSLLEKTLDVKNIFLVVGQPGSGKSTFLKLMKHLHTDNYHINTDDFNDQLKQILKKKFNEEDLIKLALKNDVALKRVVGKPWLELLTKSLLTAPKKSNVFVEIPYGLQPDKLMFRFIGGKLIYFGCDNEEENYQRIVTRGTPELTLFIKKIPGKKETMAVAKKFNLRVLCVNTSCDLKELREKAEDLQEKVKGGDLWKTYL